MPKRVISSILSTFLVLAGLFLATPAMAASVAPPWEPDPNSIGTLAFYNSSGAQVTTGTDLNHLFDYAVASTDAARATTKATLYFAFPNHNQTDSLNWFTTNATASTNYPNASAPAPVKGFTRPVASAASSDANLNAALGAAVLDQTDGYKNIVQLRLRDSGPGKPALDTFWTADISFDRTANTWTQVFPEQSTPPTATPTDTTLSASPAGTSAPGTEVTLTANVTPADAPGKIEFRSDGASIGSVDLTNGSATLKTSTLAFGRRILTAVYIPTDAAVYKTSTSSTTTYKIGSVPGAPTDVTAASSAPASAKVTWAAPTSNGGGAITGYIVQYRSTSEVGYTKSQTFNSTALSQTITGLTNGTAYLFRVAAVNAVGESEYSAATTSTTTPLALTSLAITAPTSVKYNASATLSTKLTDPANVGSASVSLYRRASSTAAWVFTKTVNTTSTGTAAVTLTGLRANTQYQWRYAGSASRRPATSATKVVSVVHVVTAAVTPGTVVHGKYVKVYGYVNPAATGQLVYLQRYVSGKWTSLGSVKQVNQKLPSGATKVGFVFAPKLGTKGTYTFRVYKPATTTLGGAVSSTLTARAT